MKGKAILSLALTCNILLTTSVYAAEISGFNMFPFFNKSDTDKKEDKTNETEKYLEVGKVNVIKKGDNFKIVLDENLTSGYVWTYKTDNKAVALMDERKIVIEPNVVGTPYKKVWRFEGRKKGTYKINYTYARPWEKDIPPIKTVEYTVKIE